MCIGGCPVHCRIFQTSLASTNQTPVVSLQVTIVTTKTVFRHCQLCPVGQNCSVEIPWHRQKSKCVYAPEKWFLEKERQCSRDGGMVGGIVSFILNKNNVKVLWVIKKKLNDTFSLVSCTKFKTFWWLKEEIKRVYIHRNKQVCMHLHFQLFLLQKYKCAYRLAYSD